MKRLPFFIFLLPLFMPAGPVAGQESNPWHVIKGQVVDEQNEPAKGAKVCAMPAGPMGAALPCSETDAQGNFSINVLWLATYTIYAEDFERGYPNAMWSFYRNFWRNAPKVTIGGTSEVPPVQIKLGPKAGRLVLTILDGSSNEPIESGSVELCRLDHPNSWWSISTGWPQGHYEILTPEMPFTIKFQTWHGEWVDRKAFDEAGVQIETVKLDLGELREVTIRLN